MYAKIVTKPCPLMPPGAQSYSCSHGKFYYTQMGWQRLLFREGVYDSIEIRFVSAKNRRRLSPKTCLRSVYGHWLHDHEIKAARKMGADRKVTQEQAELELRRLEHEASGRLAMWKMYQ